MLFTLTSPRRAFLDGEVMLTALDRLVYRGRLSAGCIEAQPRLPDGAVAVWLRAATTQRRATGVRDTIGMAVLPGLVVSDGDCSRIEIADSVLIRLQATVDHSLGARVIGVCSAGRTLELEPNAEGYVDTLLEPGGYGLYYDVGHSVPLLVPSGIDDLGIVTVR